MPDRSRPLPPAQRNRLLEAARLLREECGRASERFPVGDPAFTRLHAVASEIDALTAHLTGQPSLFGAIAPGRFH